MSAPTEVIIFFVGLTVWMEPAVPLKAILPGVVHQGDQSTQHVQEHAAAIVFHQENLDSMTADWGPPQTLQRPGDTKVYLSVPIGGEHITFDNLDSSNVAASLKGVVVPRLKDTLCPQRQALGNPYRSPYAGTTAVELSKGKLRSCVSLPADSPGRLDTYAEFTTNGNLIIHAGPKTLALKPMGGRIELMIANVPNGYYESNFAETGLSHVQAYYDMLEPSEIPCEKSIHQWWDELDGEDLDRLKVCDGLLAFPVAGPITPANNAAFVSSAANFECSNTGFP